MKHKLLIVILSFVLTTCTIVGSFFDKDIIVFADDITVASADEFKTKLQEAPNGSFIQIDDFTLPESWEGPSNFHGTYNGNGYTIKGDNTTTDLQWLFGGISAKSWTTNIQNVYLEDCGLIYSHELGANNSTNYLRIKNCHIDVYKNIVKVETGTQAWLSLYVCKCGNGGFLGESYGVFEDSSIRIHDNAKIRLYGEYSGEYNTSNNPGGIGLFACRAIDGGSNDTSPNLSFSNCFVYLGRNAEVGFYYKNNTISYNHGNIDAGVGGFVASSRYTNNLSFSNCYVFLDEDSEMKSVRMSDGRADCIIPVGTFFGSVKGKVAMNNCYAFNFGKLKMENDGGTDITPEQRNKYLHLDIGVQMDGAGSTTYNMNNVKFYIDETKNVGIGYLKEGLYDNLELGDLTNPATFSGMIDTTPDLSDDTKLFVMDSSKAPGGGSGTSMPFLKQEVNNEVDPEVISIPFTGKVGEMTIKTDAFVTAYSLGDLSTITVDFGDGTTPNIVPIDPEKITTTNGLSALYENITVSQDWLNENFTEDDIGKVFSITYAFTTGKVVHGKYKIINGNPHINHSHPVPNTSVH